MGPNMSMNLHSSFLMKFQNMADLHIKLQLNSLVNLMTTWAELGWKVCPKTHRIPHHYPRNLYRGEQWQCSFLSPYKQSISISRQNPHMGIIGLCVSMKLPHLPFPNPNCSPVRPHIPCFFRRILIIWVLSD